MPPVELITIALAFLMSGWLAARARPGARIVVWLTALLVSAAMFLPGAMLADVAGPDVVSGLKRMSRELPGTLTEIAHFVAFFWLAAVLWGLRSDWRGWKALGMLVALAIAAEIMQGLGTVSRSPKLDDVAVNLLGVGAGVVCAAMLTGVWRLAKRNRSAPAEKPVD